MVDPTVLHMAVIARHEEILRDRTGIGPLNDSRHERAARHDQVRGRSRELGRPFLYTAVVIRHEEVLRQTAAERRALVDRGLARPDVVLHLGGRGYLMKWFSWGKAFLPVRRRSTG